MASFGIGAKLRRERLGQGLSITDISRNTRISPRFLEAIEADNFAPLPGLLFTRNFVKQYALTLKLDPEPLLADLPKPDQSTIQLPNPPARSRSSYQRDQSLHSIVSSVVWLLLAGGAGIAAYVHFNHSSQTPPTDSSALAAPPAITDTTEPPPVAAPPLTNASGVQQPPAQAAPVRVSLTAHAPAWVQVSADGKISYSGILVPNETKDISASEQIKILTGNAGGLTIALNGKALDPIGHAGEVRAVRLTAAGLQFLPRDSQPVYDPL